MKIKNNSSISNTKIAIIFFVFLALIAGISLIFKIVAIARASQFDDSKRFTLTITNGRNIEIMSLSPNSKDVAIFKLNDGIKPAEAGRQLAVPIDGFIIQNSLNLDQKIDSLFISLILDYKKIKTNLTIIDLFKLAMFAKTIPEDSIHVQTIGNASGLALDKIVGHLVSDILIEKDNQTIQIINATVVGGLGNRLARFINNMGGNVIIVATDDSLKSKSTISYNDNKTYTVERLQEVLGYETVKEAGNEVADIKIVIGEDKINSAPF